MGTFHYFSSGFLGIFSPEFSLSLSVNKNSTTQKIYSVIWLELECEAASGYLVILHACPLEKSGHKIEKSTYSQTVTSHCQ